MRGIHRDPLFNQPFVKAQVKNNIKAPRHWPLWGEFTGDRWIPVIKGPVTGKCFHLMTSSYASFMLQRFILHITKWHVVPATYSELPKFEVYTNEGRFQRTSPYFYHSSLPPRIPAMQGTFVIIHLLQVGEDVEVPFFKINYMVLNTRPSPTQDGKPCRVKTVSPHYGDILMSAMVSQITGFSIACSIVCSGADLRKHQNFASLANVRGINWWPLDSPYKGPVTRKNVFIWWCHHADFSRPTTERLW